MRWLVASLLISLVASCNEETSPGASGGGGGSGGSGSAAAKPAGGGFSAELAKEFASATGSGSAQAGSGEAAAVAQAGSGEAKAGGSGDAKAGSGDAKAGSGEAKAAGSGDAKAGSGDAKAGSGDAKAAGSMEAKAAGSGDAKPAGSGDAKPAGSGDAKPAGSGDAKPAGSGDAKPAGAGSADSAPKVAKGDASKKGAVPADLAAIKFGMLPNWDRDVQGPGTLSLSVKIPGRGDSALFVFRYGYEDESAPADRDAYKKWLGDKRLLTVRQDRQAGAAWFIEGLDGRGSPAFRVVVNWGGKKLICYGSLYRDAESSKLGDLRDQTVIQAKQICETIAL